MSETQPKKKIFPRQREDFLTIFEKSWRDWLLSPLTFALHRLGITPNQVTYFSAVLIFVSIIGYSYDVFSDRTNFFILLVAIFLDMVDGSLARNHNMATTLGIWLDKIRDGIWIVWVSFFLYSHQIVSLETLGILFSFDIILALVTLRHMILQFLKLQPRAMTLKQFLTGYSTTYLPPDVFVRVNFAAWGVSYLFYLLFLIEKTSVLKSAGDIALVIAVVFGAFRIYKTFSEMLKNGAA